MRFRTNTTNAGGRFLTTASLLNEQAQVAELSDCNSVDTPK